MIIYTFNHNLWLKIRQLFSIFDEFSDNWDQRLKFRFIFRSLFYSKLKLWSISYPVCSLCRSPFCPKPVSPLSVDKIMQDPQWIGSSPSGYTVGQGRWNLFIFRWNPDKALQIHCTGTLSSGHRVSPKSCVWTPIPDTTAPNLIFTQGQIDVDILKEWKYIISNWSKFLSHPGDEHDRKESNPYFSFYESAWSILKR